MPECDPLPNHPYSPEELLSMGLLYARVSGVPDHLREDAAQEFAAAGWAASSSAEHGANLQAFQVQAARWALRNFLKAEIRRHKRQERYMNLKFGSLVDDVTPEEIDLPDPSAEDPLQKMVSREDCERGQRLLQKLPEYERSIVCEIILEGKTQEEFARQHSLSRKAVGRALKKILRDFEKSLSADGFGVVRNIRRD